VFNPSNCSRKFKALENLVPSPGLLDELTILNDWFSKSWIIGEKQRHMRASGTLHFK
jgi:hypothetical protein